MLPKANLAIAAAVTALVAAVDGFVVPQPSRCSADCPVVLFARGFGDSPKKAPTETQSEKADAAPKPESSVPNPFDPVPQQEKQDMSSGKAMLEAMRREQAEKRNAELRRMKEVKDVDAMLRESPEAAAIPEKVAQRMGRRMLPFVGVPLFGGMGVFVGFWYMATYRDMEFEPALVAASTIIILVVGLLGITYSVMSASWDEDREGSFLGTEEFSRNVQSIKDGLSRSKENARLRDRMMSVPDKAFQDLDKNEAAKDKRTKSFQQKIGDEFE